MTRERDFDYRREQKMVSSPWRLGRLWGSSRFLSDVYRRFFSRGKAAGCMTTNASFSDEVAWAIPPQPSYVFMTWCLISQAHGQLYDYVQIILLHVVILWLCWFRVHDICILFYIFLFVSSRIYFADFKVSLFFLEGIMFLLSDDGCCAREASCRLVFVELTALLVWSDYTDVLMK
jgi:hypothetical protein